MKKILGILSSTLLVALAATLFFVTRGKNETVYPFPYDFKTPLLTNTENSAIKKSNILILGDENALLFKDFEKIFRSKLINELVNINITNLGEAQTGLHRHLRKMNEIDHLPEVVFYFVGRNEFLEKRFELDSINNIAKNFKIFQKDLPVSLIHLFPWTSKILYKRVNYVDFTKDIIPKKNLKNVVEKQSYIKGLIKTYELELQNLIENVLFQEKTIVLITAPINLDLLPREVCRNATNENLNKELTKHAQNLLEGDFKTAFKELNSIKDKVNGNSRFHYLIGRSLSMMGQFKNSKNEFYKANAYDCNPQGPSHLINSVARKLAINYEVPLIDLERIVNNDFGKNVVFFNNNRPQNLYYEKFVKLLASYTNNYFSL